MQYMLHIVQRLQYLDHAHKFTQVHTMQRKRSFKVYLDHAPTYVSVTNKVVHL